VEFHDTGKWEGKDLGADKLHTNWGVNSVNCPKCLNKIISVVGFFQSVKAGQKNEQRFLVYPRSVTRPLPAGYATEFAEAVAVLPDSPKASAALSRRLLQRALREKGGASKKDLFDQIEEVLPRLPGYLQDLHAIRNIGNFAAHPLKDTNTGEIVDVEPGEAEWLLDILERLFDFYFVQEAIRKQRIVELNVKLKAAGKPELPVT
jgi:uncharacterized protein DUF4145